MFKAAKAGSRKAITANLLRDGVVVFLDADGRWVRKLGEALLVADGPELDRAAAYGQAQAEARIVVEPYPIDVEIVGDAPVPVRLRERIRAVGPTVDYGADEFRRLTAAS